jgi:hypothetical protein
MTNNQDVETTTGGTRRYTGSIEIDYWNIDQANYQDKLAFLMGKTKEELATAIVNYHYDTFCKDNADAKDDEERAHSSGKRIPYIGWFWRSINFLGYVPIGIMYEREGGDSLIGFMANNKWDYPERYLTDEERLRVISYLDIAIGCTRSNKTGKAAALKELWDYMQTLSIS